MYNQRDADDIIHLNPTTGRKTNLGTVPNVAGIDGEGCLTGLEINPASFSSNHWLYIIDTSSSDNRVVRIKYDPSTDKIVTSSEQVLVSGILRNKYHDGGRLRFFRDGRYRSPPPATRRTGTMRRTATASTARCCASNPDGSIPSDNPFGNAVWSYGHRNPQGLAFDSQGRLWEQEFGTSIMDETNLIVKGGNYGWPICEGTGDGTGSCDQSGLIALEDHRQPGRLPRLGRVRAHRAELFPTRRRQVEDDIEPDDVVLDIANACPAEAITISNAVGRRLAPDTRAEEI
jgi:Glucose / Sorbosone dehydrogenase